MRDELHCRKMLTNKKAGEVRRPFDLKCSTSEDADQGVNPEIQSGWQTARSRLNLGHRMRSEKRHHQKSVDLSITSPAHSSSPKHLGANANAILVIIWHDII
jgi:hypothetical protein